MQRVVTSRLARVCRRSCVRSLRHNRLSLRRTGLRESMRQLSRRRYERREGSGDPDLGPLPCRQRNRLKSSGKAITVFRRRCRMRNFGSCLSDARKLAGTNPAMATGGYTGSRTAPLPPESFPPSEPRPAVARHRRQPTRRLSRWRMAVRERGSCLASRSPAPSCSKTATRGFTLLSRDGDVYREKPIAPKRDWVLYDGSLHRQPLQHARSDRRIERAASRTRLDVAHARVTSAADACRGRRHHVCHGLERAAGGRCDDGARVVDVSASLATAESSARPASASIEARRSSAIASS